MYHITNFGGFAQQIARYADIDGFVPEAGDAHEDMRWDSSGPGWDDDQWADYVDEAVAATEKASDAVIQQREDNDEAQGIG